METTKRSPLDLDFPRTGAANDAYEVATTTLFLCAAWDKTEGEQGHLAPARHAVVLHRISGALHRISERQCNGETGLDKREARLEADANAIANHYGLMAYFQGDPRGCSLYLIDVASVPSNLDRYRWPNDKPGTTRETLKRRWIDANYNQGHAVVRLGR